VEDPFPNRFQSRSVSTEESRPDIKNGRGSPLHRLRRPSVGCYSISMESIPIRGVRQLIHTFLPHDLTIGSIGWGEWGGGGD
jgi:hypothetical protein